MPGGSERLCRQVRPLAAITALCSSGKPSPRYQHVGRSLFEVLVGNGSSLSAGTAVSAEKQLAPEGIVARRSALR